MISSQEIFQQCHDHIRIAEHRRDVAIGLLVTFALALLTKSNESQCGSSLAFTIIAIGTFILLGLFRRWKLIHLHAASVFMKFPGDALPSREQANKRWDEIVKTKEQAKKKWYKIFKDDSGLRFNSLDFWLLFIAAAVSAVISIPFIADKLVCCKQWFCFLLSGVGWFGIAWTTHALATRNLHVFPEYAWMFRGLENSPK